MSTPGCPGIVRVSQDTQTMEVELCPSRDDPGIVRVSRESQDTQAREVELCPSGMILGSSEYPRNPRILRQGRYIELCPSRDDPGIVRVSRESQDTQTREVELHVCPSWDDPEMVEVSQEVHV